MEFLKLKTIIAKIMKVSEEDVLEDSLKKDFVLWDSLSQIILVMEIEHVFQIKFSIDEIVAIDGVRSILDMLNTKTRS